MMHYPTHFLGPDPIFPPVSEANSEGLLAVGGDLSPERVLAAYQNGIFPWFNEDHFIMWWSPDPRMIIIPEEIKISKSMRKLLREKKFTISFNTDFEAVIDQCATIPRFGEEGTWITPKMKEAYLKLHALGHAKSIEVRQNGYLVGGLYGMDLGHVFCGESMFSIVSNASKLALIYLAQYCQENNYKCIDCQMYTPHLESMGGKEIDRNVFISLLK